MSPWIMENGANELTITSILQYLMVQLKFHPAGSVSACSKGRHYS
jgi:hypothetical protein